MLRGTSAAEEKCVAIIVDGDKFIAMVNLVASDYSFIPEPISYSYKEYIKPREWIVKSSLPVTTEEKITDDITITLSDGSEKTYKGGNTATIYTIHYSERLPVYEALWYYEVNRDYNYRYDYANDDKLWLSTLRLGVIFDDDDNITAVIMAEIDEAAIVPANDYEYTTKELITLAKHISGRADISTVDDNGEVTIYDVNGDGKINSDDLLYMIKILTGEIY